jgi:tRNA(Ser,Leu) C12 N-acetylase TAN1
MHATDAQRGLVAAVKKVERATLYSVNLNNPMVKMLIEHETQLSLQTAEREKAKMQKS